MFVMELGKIVQGAVRDYIGFGQEFAQVRLICCQTERKMIIMSL